MKTKPRHRRLNCTDHLALWISRHQELIELAARTWEAIEPWIELLM